MKDETTVTVLQDILEEMKGINENLENIAAEMQNMRAGV